MKSKAERRLTKRLRRDNAQIIADCNATTHPFFIFPTVIVVLILEFKEEFEMFEFQYPRILRQIHDYCVLQFILLIDAAIDEIDANDWRSMETHLVVSASAFDYVLETEAMDQRCLGILNLVKIIRGGYER